MDDNLASDLLKLILKSQSNNSRKKVSLNYVLNNSQYKHLIEHIDEVVDYLESHSFAKFLRITGKKYVVTKVTLKGKNLITN